MKKEIIYGSVVNPFGEKCFLKYTENPKGTTECCFYDNPCIDHKTDVFIESVYNALGWQGGTIHQVVNEIKRLRADLSCDGCINNPSGVLECKKCKRNNPYDYYIKMR